MEYAKLGNTGMDVSRICLGCMGFGDAERWIHKWVLNEDSSRPIIQKALECLSEARAKPFAGRACQDSADQVPDALRRPAQAKSSARHGP